DFLPKVDDFHPGMVLFLKLELTGPGFYIGFIRSHRIGETPSSLIKKLPADQSALLFVDGQLHAGESSGGRLGVEFNDITDRTFHGLGSTIGGLVIFIPESTEYLGWAEAPLIWIKRTYLHLVHFLKINPKGFVVANN